MQLSELVVNFTILLAAALVGGMVAHRLKQPLILGYLVVGVVIGPLALGLVTDITLVQAMATIGVALLMLTLGLEVSFGQLRQVGRVGLWGGVMQIVATTGLGILMAALLLKWTLPQSILFGLIVAQSSTMVGLKLLTDRGELDSMHGRIMIALLIAQDITVTILIVITPFLSGARPDLLNMLFTIGAILLFVGIAIASGIWILPWLMGSVAGVRTRELFLLTILVMSLGAGVGTQVFGLSAVFGAFLIGIVIRETRFAQQALAEIIPLRDIFAALFFVSLGMLLDPRFVVNNWLLITVMVALVMVIKFLPVSGIVRGFGYSSGIAFLTGAGLVQIGEFGFILAQAGFVSGLFSADIYSLILSSSISTMLLTPLVLSITSRVLFRFTSTQALDNPPDLSNLPSPQVIVAGYGWGRTCPGD